MTAIANIPRAQIAPVRDYETDAYLLLSRIREELGDYMDANPLVDIQWEGVRALEYDINQFLADAPLK